MAALTGWLGNPPESYKRSALTEAATLGTAWCSGFDTGVNGFHVEQWSNSPIAHADLERLIASPHPRTLTSFFSEPPERIEDYNPKQGLGVGLCREWRCLQPADLEDQVRKVLTESGDFAGTLVHRLARLFSKVKGGLATAFFRDEQLFLATTYRPLFFHTDWRTYFLFSSSLDGLPKWSHSLDPFSVNRVHLTQGRPYYPRTVHLRDRRTRNPLVEADTVVTQQVPGYWPGQEHVPRYEMSTRHMERWTNTSKKVLVAMSGGIDSTTVAYFLKKTGWDVTLVYVKYHTKSQEREIDHINQIADHGGFRFLAVDCPVILRSNLTAEGELVKGAFQSWVAARNLTIMTLLTAMAETRGIGAIAIGTTDNSTYTDDSAEFGRRFQEVLEYSTASDMRIELLHPLSRRSKVDILELAFEVGVPLELTWSCYDSGDKPCGTCASCKGRAAGFAALGKDDPALKGD